MACDRCNQDAPTVASVEIFSKAERHIMEVCAWCFNDLAAVLHSAPDRSDIDDVDAELDPDVERERRRDNAAA